MNSSKSSNGSNSPKSLDGSKKKYIATLDHVADIVETAESDDFDAILRHARRMQAFADARNPRNYRISIHTDNADYATDTGYSDGLTTEERDIVHEEGFCT